MLLRNYNNWKTWIENNPITSTSLVVSNDMGIVDTSNSAITRIMMFNSGYLPYASKNWSVKLNASMVFGAGSTEPSVTDYALDTDITSQLSLSSFSISVGSDTNGMTVLCSVSVQNNTNSSITIKEVGLLHKFVDDNLYEHSCLLSRTILDTPVTIASGGVKLFTYSLVLK